MADRLKGRRIVITGTASGIGRALVDRFLAEGAQVVAMVRRESDFENFQVHDRLKLVIGDVRLAESNELAVESAVTEFGGLDAFIANAGIWDFYKKLSAMSADQVADGYQSIFDVNVKGILLGAHASFPALKDSKGSFIATGSNACFKAGGGGVLYTASKFALRGIIKQLAMEFAPEVRVNAVAPGATNTPISGSDALGHAKREMNSDPARIAKMADHIPLNLVSRPEDHTGAFVLLASVEDANYMTGTIIKSEGGLTL
ncbi:MAG: SDR family NAD(P)-dependent oxidoreductase [Pseudomonadota bacterium]